MLRMPVSYEHSWMTNTAKGRFDDILHLSPGSNDDTGILGEIERLADTGQNPYIDLALILSSYFGRAVHIYLQQCDTWQFYNPHGCINDATPILLAFLARSHVEALLFSAYTASSCVDIVIKSQDDEDKPLVAEPQQA